MLIRYSPKSRELSITGSREDFTLLASMIRKGSGAQMSNHTGSSAPYEMLLGGIVVENLPGKSVAFSVTKDNHLSIAGDAHKMVVLAENVESIAEAVDTEGHWHIEYSPDHFFLAPDSLPVVFDLSFSARNQKFSTLQ